jgi:acyl-CoA thioesterase-1
MPVVCLGLLSACSLRAVQCGGPGQPAANVEQSPVAATPDSPATPSAFKIVFLGDSLTAGMGLLTQQAFPALIEDAFLAEGYNVEVVNAGISGDTTAGGRRRVEQALEGDARILVVALGANDALRGLTVAETYDNLAAIIEAARDQDLAVLLAGMEAPTNYGQDYRDAFRDVFVRLARQYRSHVTFVPFLLEGVAGDPALNQADGIHPNEKGAHVIADALYPRLRTLVDQMGGG